MRTTLIKALPLCCGLLMAASNRDCTIHLIVDQGEGEAEGEGDDGGEGEGQTGGDCQVDSDCGQGQVCVLEANCPPCANDAAGTPCPLDAAGNAPCLLEGRCEDAQPGQCRADADCGPDAFCDFSSCGRDPATGNGGTAPIVVCDTGVCAPLPPPNGCDTIACPAGTHCVDGSATGGGQPPSGGANQPLPPDPNGGPQCIPDDNGCPALCGPGQQCVILADGTVGCEPVRVPCNTDADCSAGQTCTPTDVCILPPVCNDPTNPNCIPPVCNGFCTDPQPASCFADTDCAQGEVCALVTTCPACTNASPPCELPCQVDGKCVPASAGGTPPPAP